MTEVPNSEQDSDDSLTKSSDGGNDVVGTTTALLTSSEVIVSEVQAKKHTGEIMKMVEFNLNLHKKGRVRRILRDCVLRIKYRMDKSVVRIMFFLGESDECYVSMLQMAFFE